VELLLRQSAAGLFVVFIYALVRGEIVVGRQHETEVKQLQERYEALLAEKQRQIDALQVRCDRWERIALKAVNVADAAVGTGEARREAS
jgi:hypothetical protein